MNREYLQEITKNAKKNKSRKKVKDIENVLERTAEEGKYSVVIDFNSNDYSIDDVALVLKYFKENTNIDVDFNIAKVYNSSTGDVFEEKDPYRLLFYWK